jgi:hypothetical protein
VHGSALLEEVSRKLDVVMIAMENLGLQVGEGRDVLMRIDDKTDKIDRNVEKTGQDVRGLVDVARSRCSPRVASVACLVGLALAFFFWALALS